MALKPWRNVVFPREDLRDGRPLDAAEFAVHLDKVRTGNAPNVYQKPEEFFNRTFLTKNLLSLAAETVRRLSGVTTETSAVFNMATQFGGGKTHALTLLYHLAREGASAKNWQGVSSILSHAGGATIPKASVAIFVGTEFDSITGRGGDDGTPRRMTPWGEIAWQLGGKEAFNIVAEHDAQRTSPGGDVISRFLPQNTPTLILMDELMNYMSRNRKSGLASQFYAFLHNLSETCRGLSNSVLAVSVPGSELEMTVEDEGDYLRIKKVLDRLGKAVIMTQEAETSEIIRRRLFEWDPKEVAPDGKVLLRKDALETCKEYAQWIQDHKTLIPGWFSPDNALDAFKASYPFHPSLISVFERKWQAVQRFQRTRGALRLLALWVSRVYSDSYKHAHKDPLITLGTAPMDDPLFRSALFEQLGEDKLEVAVSTDIAGKKESFAVRLDEEAIDAIKKSRLHRKVATSILFESNGGQAKGEATQPEIRLAVAEPDLDIGNIETVLEELESNCYYLITQGTKYRFDIKPNLNKILADRRASVKKEDIEEKVKSEIQKVFSPIAGAERMFFPEKSGNVTDKAALSLVILAPDYIRADKDTITMIDQMTKEYGTSNRFFKSALLWIVPESSSPMKEEARKLLAWESVKDEAHDLRLDEIQKKQVEEKIKIAGRDLKESVWRAYKNVYFLGMDNNLRNEDLGLINSSAAESLPALIINHLCQKDELIKEAPNVSKITKNWPPALPEWSTKSVRDAFFASPRFPRLLKPDSIKETVAKGVSNGLLAYVSKDDKGGYDEFHFGEAMVAADIEISEDMFIITKEKAEEYKKRKEAGITPPEGEPEVEPVKPGNGKDGKPPDEPPVKPLPKAEVVNKISWSGRLSWKKWQNFYQKVLSRFANEHDMRITVNFEVSSEDGISTQKIEETKVALRELGMEDNLDVVKSEA